MARRPVNLDLSGADNAPSPNMLSPRRMHIDLPSPRAGEIPPALSPLDMFAQQSRMLAKRFEESQQKGRRISRLEHSEIANEFGRRPTYFRTLSGQSEESDHSQDAFTVGDGQRPQIEEPQQQSVKGNALRPMSHYPRFSSTVHDTGDQSKRNTATSDMWFDASDGKNAPIPEESYFGIQVPRASSPEPYERNVNTRGDATPALPSLTSSIDSMTSSQIRTNTDESTASRRVERGLIPPRSPLHPRGKKNAGMSIRSVIDNNEEDNHNIDYAAEVSRIRKFSHSSAASASRPRSPLTPDAFPTCRSPSMGSERSADTNHFQRPSFNFSRPLSSAGSHMSPTRLRRSSSQSKTSYESRPSFEFPIRQSSIDHSRSPLRQTTTSARNSLEEPPRLQRQNTEGETSLETANEAANAPNQSGAPSYIYSKYSLPRGRTVDRGSMGDRLSWMQHQIKYDHPSIAQTAPTTPEAPGMEDFEDERRPFRQALATSSARSHSADGRGPTAPRQSNHQYTPSSPSVISHSTNSTLRAYSRNSPSADIVNLTAEEHLEKGIECHSSGSLSKSTYHLRLAARAGHPTAMLLYALACRHGWGMRPNQQEGVQWLKKAVDSSSIDMMSDSGPINAMSIQQDSTSQASKARKTEFALAIYELGISYMNGWGIPKDKTLAVRCFEISGNWGDMDALAEAGFCYTQGIGCKKDLKKAACFYRRAAEGGMSMAGNSWIYKEKYMDTPVVPLPPYVDSSNPSNSDKSTRSSRSRSRARSLFGRKKTNT